MRDTAIDQIEPDRVGGFRIDEGLACHVAAVVQAGQGPAGVGHRTVGNHPDVQSGTGISRRRQQWRGEQHRQDALEEPWKGANHEDALRRGTSNSFLIDLSNNYHDCHILV